MILFATSVEEEIKAIASMASLALALLAFFTNMRFGALKKYEEDRIPGFGLQTVRGALPDLGLALFTGAAVFVMAPLCFDGFSFSELGHRSGAVGSMFALIWLGFVALLAFQVAMAIVRIRKAVVAGS